MLKIPQNIKKIISVLENAGYEAYIVGGAVRDYLLGKKPEDFDITTSCPPEKIITLFDKTIPTGIKHGTVTVVAEDTLCEVTTYRIDGEYHTNRAPESVTFTGNLPDDLSRRDFTINAMAYNEKDGLVDLFSGHIDLNTGIIKTVGEAEKRFCEDALRILRAVRFACQLGFRIENKTRCAAIKLSERLDSISGERIFTELSKALLSDNLSELEYFINNGGLKSIGINSATALNSINMLPKTLYLRFFAFLMLNDADFKKTVQRLKFSNNLCEQIEKLYRLSTFGNSFNRVTLKQMLNVAKYDIVLSYLTFTHSIRSIDTTNDINLLKDVIQKNEPYCISMLDISGDDIAQLGFNGKEIGKVLSFLLNECIVSPTLNRKKILIKLIESKYSN